MKIKWIGLSCFLLVSDAGVRIITDPFTPHFYGRDYGRIDENADIVTVSHHHADHDCVSVIGGNPDVFEGAGNYHCRGIDITGIKSFHDSAGGWERGDNTIFCFDVDGVRICHLGDLGHLLTDEQLFQMGNVDVLLFPAGGKATIDPADAKIMVDIIRPKIAIPIHFNTGRLTLPFATKDLLKVWPDMEIAGSSGIEVLKEELSETTKVMLLKESL